MTNLRDEKVDSGGGELSSWRMSLKRPRVAILAVASASGEQGGAERLYLGLRDALIAAGVDAELVSVISNESDFDNVKESYLRFYDLDLTAFDGVISTKAPSYAVRHRNHICYLLHTMRSFYDLFDLEFAAPDATLLEYRRLIHTLDSAALKPPHTRRVFVIGREVQERLLSFNGLRSEILPPASTLSGFRTGGFRYLLLPGRLHRWKRVDLVIEAMRYVRSSTELLIAGVGEDAGRFQELAADNQRIKFLGRVTDSALLDLYANALAVPFVPRNEDFGLVTLEAFLSGKPVITCEDSGEPARLVRDQWSGYICAPDPRVIAERIDRLAENSQLAAEMGRRGAESISHISWTNVAENLIAALGLDKSRVKRPIRSSIKATILDMQPIEPAVGGGRLRLLGLYHALGEGIMATYVGTYDWPGPGFRRHHLTPTLEEIDVPLSERHFAAAAQKQRQVGGKTVIDSTFHKLAHLSPDYVAAARDAVTTADVVIFSHPWIYPSVSDLIDTKRQLVVYDSQNVEGLLRATLLDDGAEGGNIVRDVIAVERALCQACDLVLACSQEDRQLFARLYNIAIEKIRIIPNGVFTEHIRPADSDAKRAARKRLRLDERPAAIFLGSMYQPNVEAAAFIIEELAPRLSNVQFVIAGGVGDGLSTNARSASSLSRVRITGPIADAEKLEWLAAVDFAINPMFSGSGTNIKMFDFMAAGLPVVTTPVGARGIEAAQSVFEVCEPKTFLEGVKSFAQSHERRHRLGEAARLHVGKHFSWERISPHLGHILRRHLRRKEQRPFFSVVIPTYERHELLTRLVDLLALQTFTDFEIIVVDQSKELWPDRDRDFAMELHYVHTDVKGPAMARNTGANLACGQVVAFIDDDCEPSSGWLEKASAYFNDPAAVGLEGLIRSNHPDDPDWRPVTNEGLAGIGFMTANLFIRLSTFNAINGFDPAFDEPFREDTDLGWRAQQHGTINFSTEAWVFHPAQKRTSERASQAVRNRFFEKDALLLKKHPERYQELFMREGHWQSTPGFWQHFLAGMNKYNVDLPDFIRKCLAEAKEAGTFTEQG